MSLPRDTLARLGVDPISGLVAAAVLTNVADLLTFLRANPSLIPAEETSPLPHLLGQTAGGLVAKAAMAIVVVVTVMVFRRRPRTAAVLLVAYTLLGVVGAASNTLIG